MTLPGSGKPALDTFGPDVHTVCGSSILGPTCSDAAHRPAPVPKGLQGQGTLGHPPPNNVNS